MSEEMDFQCSFCGFSTKNLEALLQHPCVAPSSPSTSNELSGKGSLQKWEDRYVRLLIQAYKHLHKDLVKKGKVTKKEIFRRIAEHFDETADVTVSGEQCLRKWIKLEQKFKEVEDNNKRTGQARKDWKFLDEMTDCIGESPKVNPAFCFDVSLEAHESSSPSVSNNSSNGNANDSNSSDADEERKQLKPRRQRKRKNYSSAAEMLTFLQVYTEKREKAEEEKVNLLREMKEEKKQFFNQFLDVLKNK